MSHQASKKHEPGTFALRALALYGVGPLAKAETPGAINTEGLTDPDLRTQVRDGRSRQSA
jgi:hypothetical protein